MGERRDKKLRLKSMLEWFHSTGHRPYEGVRGVEEFQRGNRILQDRFDFRLDVKEWVEAMFSREIRPSSDRQQM